MKTGFLRETNGQLSIVRLALLLANIVMVFSIGIWGIVSLKNNTVAPFPYEIVILVCSANGWKVIQKFTEGKTGEPQ